MIFFLLATENGLYGFNTLSHYQNYMLKPISLVLSLINFIYP